MKLLFKTLFLFIFSSIILSGCGYKKTGKFDFDKYHKKRPASPAVKSIKTYQTLTDSAHPNSAEMLLSEVEYSVRGLKWKETYYIPDSGKIDYFTVTNYDNNGNAIETHTEYPSTHYESTEKNSYDNDKHVLTTDWTRTDGNGQSSGRHDYKYDSHGKMIKWDVFEKGKFVTCRIYEYIYDDQGRPVESFCKETKNNKDTSVDCHEKYAYDSITGRESGKIVLIENEVPLEIIESQYDTAGNKILEIQYERDSIGKLKPDTRIINVFNEYGEGRQSVTFKDNKEQSTSDNTYDDYGHLIETRVKDASG